MSRVVHRVSLSKNFLSIQGKEQHSVNHQRWTIIHQLTFKRPRLLQTSQNRRAMKMKCILWMKQLSIGCLTKVRPLVGTIGYGCWTSAFFFVHASNETLTSAKRSIYERISPRRVKRRRCDRFSVSLKVASNTCTKEMWLPKIVPSGSNWDAKILAAPSAILRRPTYVKCSPWVRRRTPQCPTPSCNAWPSVE